MGLACDATCTEMLTLQRSKISQVVSNTGATNLKLLYRLCLFVVVGLGNALEMLERQLILTNCQIQSSISIREYRMLKVTAALSSIFQNSISVQFIIA